MKIYKEFKEFAIKGNMFDMAVGIIIGTAFSKVVSSLVQDIIMPPIGVLLGKVNFENLVIILQPQKLNASGKMIQEQVVLQYGSFIQLTIDFLVIAFAMFVVIKVFNRIRKKAENEKDKSEATPKNVELLSEIRDLLKESKSD
ncbi:large-conductance mechanosensitive channel protein MscL [Salibacter sp.]|jgi:large conductance mechanosensitive channel|uniref:large-conductance mechanosensitive channel protein MscL n=1 Tax=Salibacter sp. TaxID=2010995 RepID=UPI00287025FD|nr:large-conductance mechanosensitive channel protein MscL [Salibacter sp.]MDR9487689.1 large-conductance mechanosensitive channel protein MscL [Salibacter sp.]